MGICCSKSETLQGSAENDKEGNSPCSPNSPKLTKEPSRVSVHCLLSSEFDEDNADRLTIIEGSHEDQSKFGGLFGYKCIKGSKSKYPNTDDFFVIQDPNFSLYGVFDGHGPEGHKVANYAQDKLPDLIMSHPDFYSDPKRALFNAFKQVDSELGSMTSAYVDAEMSGTTATIVLQLSDQIFIAHVGDSKAVVLTDVYGILEATYTTTDHKPNLADEATRIKLQGGEIRTGGENSPSRFYQRGTNLPGLLVSRTLGNTRFQPYGLSYEPELVEIAISPSIRYVVVATDGVWEYIKPSYAAKLLNRIDDVQIAAEKLVKKALDYWTIVSIAACDDITAVVSAIQSS